MGKEAAFGTIISIGTRQVETATVSGTIVDPGNARVIVTATTLVAESPVTTDVAVLAGDTASVVAGKIRTALGAVGNLTDHFAIGGSGPTVVLTALLPAANNASVNIDINNETCTGLDDAPNSVNTTAGVAYVAVADITTIDGPELSLDTVDVTTHDSTSGWEEVVTTILRSGEVSLDIVYDPGAASHSNATDGLNDRYENKKLTHCKVTFPGPYDWIFPAYVTGYKPSEPSDGALTAAVKLKIDGVPTLV